MSNQKSKFLPLMTTFSPKYGMNLGKPLGRVSRSSKRGGDDATNKF